MVWLYGCSCGKSFFNVLEKIHVPAAKTIYNLDWYTPSDQILARSNWSTTNCFYEYHRLLSLAHDCFYDFSPTSIKQLFREYDCNYQLGKKLTFLLPKPVAGEAQWWEHSPPTNVAWVRFPDSRSYVGWLCCWFSSRQTVQVMSLGSTKVNSTT